MVAIKFANSIDLLAVYDMSVHTVQVGLRLFEADCATAGFCWLKPNRDIMIFGVIKSADVVGFQKIVTIV